MDEGEWIQEANVEESTWIRRPCFARKAVDFMAIQPGEVFVPNVGVRITISHKPSRLRMTMRLQQGESKNG